MTDFTTERAQVIAAANSCRSQALQTGNGGNISVRIAGTDLMAVKATGASFSDTDLSAVVISDYGGDLVEGGRRPTKESLLHGAIYTAFPEVSAVVHCHSPWATGWATTGRPLPNVTYHSELKLGGPVTVIDTGRYSVLADRVPEVLAAFNGPPAIRAVLLKGHGFVALGRDIKDAMQTAELVEETAQIAVIGELLRGVGPS